MAFGLYAAAQMGGLLIGPAIGAVDWRQRIGSFDTEPGFELTSAPFAS